MLNGTHARTQIVAGDFKGATGIVVRYAKKVTGWVLRLTTRQNVTASTEKVADAIIWYSAPTGNEEKDERPKRKTRL